jgi:hypothetical protein
VTATQIVAIVAVAGLFQRVMLMSGTAISPGIVRDTAINATWALDNKLHCRSFNSTELLDCFRKRHRDEVLDFPVRILPFCENRSICLRFSAYFMTITTNSSRSSTVTVE